MTGQWLITFRSITFAQRAERVLKSRKVDCQLQRTPKALTERGCGYCLRLRAVDAPIAIEHLKRKQVSYGKLYALDGDGSTQEKKL